MQSIDEKYRDYYNTSPYPDADWAMGGSALQNSTPLSGGKDGPKKPTLLERVTGLFGPLNIFRLTH